MKVPAFETAEPPDESLSKEGVAGGKTVEAELNLL